MANGPLNSSPGGVRRTCITMLVILLTRLTEMFTGSFEHLRLMAFDPYDLALSKLERNSQKDRDDMRFLARSIPFDLSILQERYATEMRWQLGVPSREDLTLQLWIEAIGEDRNITSP